MSFTSTPHADRLAPEHPADSCPSGTRSVGAALVAYFSAVSASVVAALALVGAGVPVEVLLSTF